VGKVSDLYEGAVRTVKMSILLASTIGPPDRWITPIKDALPNEDLKTNIEADDLSKVDVALFAHKVPGVFARLPNLKLIIGLQAGVDSLLADPELPADIPVARAGDLNGDRMIAEYVLLHVLRHHRNMPFFVENQRKGVWEKPEVLEACERRVGIMGMGLIATPCATLLRDIGFQLASWTRTPNSTEGIENFHGTDALSKFLARTEILINVLPVTAETEDILCAKTFSMLPKGANFINIGRGQHVVDADLIEALDTGYLNGATLDVYRQEPLPSEHPFWSHPKITLMPHTARKTRPASIAPQIAENVRRLRAGEPILQLVDREAGY